MVLSLRCVRAERNRKSSIMPKCVPIQRKSKQRRPIHFNLTFGHLDMSVYTLHLFVCLLVYLCACEPQNFFLFFFPFHRDWDGLKLILHEMIDATVSELLQPNENNLIPQSDK